MADKKYSMKGQVEYFLVNDERVKVLRVELTEQIKLVMRINGERVRPGLHSCLSDNSIKRLKDWQSAD